MHKTNRMANMSVEFALLDFIMIMISYRIAFMTTNAHQQVGITNGYMVLSLSFCVVYFLFMVALRMYNMSTIFYLDTVIKNTCVSLFGTFMIVFVYLFWTYNSLFDRMFFVVFICMGLVLLNMSKLCMLKLKPVISKRLTVIYVGDAKIYDKFVRFIEMSGYNFKILGYIDMNNTSIEGIKYLGHIDDFEMTLKQNPCDHIVFTYSMYDSKPIEKYLNIADEMGIVTKVILDTYALELSKSFVSNLGTYPIITYYNVTLNRVSLTVKRCMDIVGALFGIIITSPIMLVTAIFIWLDSPGPIVFSQVRVGCNGKKFKIYKFRSMYMDAEKRKKELMDQNQMSDSRIFKMKDDPRITRVGKFIRKTSIDEIPQFFNVLIGNMSLVGTRPPTVDEVLQYGRQHWRRISIKPGITGVWQTSGRNDVKDFEEIVKMDISYIENWSLLLDIRLLFKTIKVLVNKKGAC